jgi:predicted NodU family carbamoyl transferase
LRAKLRGSSKAFYRFTDQGGEVLRKIIGHWCGIGAVYGHTSKLIFGDYLDAGKTMGLAPYGRPYSTRMFLEETGPEDLRAFTRLTSQQRSALRAESKSGGDILPRQIIRVRC